MVSRVTVLILIAGCGAKSALVVDELARDAGEDSSRDAAMDARPDAYDVGVDSPPEVSVDAPPDGFDAGPLPRPCDRPRPVDVLVVVDASGSMVDEIRDFGAQVDTLLRDMVRPPDRDGDGVEDWSAVNDLHVAFTSTHLDGELNTTSSAPGCSGSFPRFHAYRNGDDVESFIHDAACVATPDTRARAGEQLFSTALRAILPRGTSYPIERPLGDTANAGFLRSEGLLLLVFLTDEDDYSACRLGGCDPRCGMHTCEVGSIAEYANAFRLVRDPEQMTVAVIAGMPDGISEPDEIFRLSDEAPRSEYICQILLRGALPAPRVIELALEFDPVLESICVPDFTNIARHLAERVGDDACVE